jgi:hypothetical protein
MVVTVVVIAIMLTVLTLVAAAWTGRSRAPGVGGDDLGARRSGDPWHGDPGPDVAGRPAGADAEAMSPDPDPAPRPPDPPPGARAE